MSSQPMLELYLVILIDDKLIRLQWDSCLKKIFKFFLITDVGVQGLIFNKHILYSK